MRIQLLPLVLGPIALLLVACGNRVTVSTRYDPTISFAKYHTFALDAAPPELDPLGRQTLEQSLRSRLSGRGLREEPANKANLQVVCRIVTEAKQVGSNVAGRVYFPSNFGRYSGTASVMQAPESTEQLYGALIIDFIDAESREIVFRGIGKAPVKTEEKNAAAIQLVVSKVVDAIPRLGQR